MDTTEEDDEMSVIMSGYCMPSLSDMSSDFLLSQSQYAKVIFHDLLPMYPTDADIWCRYSVTSGVVISHGDRVALYRVGWNHIQDHVHFEVAPVPAVHPGPHTQLQVLFKAENLPKDKSEFYQLCYVSVEGAVCGASVPFQFQQVGEGELCEVEGEGGLLEVRSCTAVGLTQLREATQEIEELRVELEEAKEELKEVKGELKEAKGELEQAKGEVANKAERLAEGSLTTGMISGELEEANGKVAELKRELEEVKEQLEDKTVLVDEGSLAERKLRGELEEVKGQLADKTALVEGGRLAERKQRGELEQFKINAAQLGAAIVKLTNEKAALTDLVSKSRGTNSAEMNRLQIQVDNMQQMLDASTQSKEMATRVLRCEQVKVMTLNIEHDKYKFRSQQLEAEVGRLKEEWERERGEWQKEKGELDQQLEQCAQEIARANDTWVGNANSIHRLTADVAHLKTENAGLATENAGLKTVNAGLKNVNGGLTTEASALASENAELKMENAGLKTDNAGLKTENAGLKADNAGLKTENAGLKADNAGLKTENAQLKTSGAWAKTVVAGLTADVAGQASENAALKADSARVRSEMVRLREENAALKTENVGLKAEQRPTGDGAASEDGDEGINSLDLGSTVRIMESQNRRANLEIRLAEQVAEEAALLARRDDLDRELGEHETRASRLQRELSTDRTSLALIARKMQDVQEQILRDDRAMANSEEDSLAVEERLQRMSKRSHELECKIVAADAQAHDLAQMARVLGEERGDLIGRLVAAAGAKEALEREREEMGEVEGRQGEAEDLRRRLDMGATEYRKVYVQMRRAEKRLAKMKQKQSSGEAVNVADAGYVCPTCSAAFPLPATAVFLAHLEDHLS